MRSRVLFTSFALAAAAALVMVAAAGGGSGRGNDNNNCKRSQRNGAVTVFNLGLTPKQEVPRITGLRAKGVGHLTLDVTRDSAGAVTSGDVVFYVNYKFPGSVTITGLHVHKAKKGENGDIVVDSGVGSFTDTDGVGNVTAVVTNATPVLLQAILDTPRDYYVNLHTSVNPGGALRDQLTGCSKRKKDNDDD